MKKEYSIWISWIALVMSILIAIYVIFDCRPIKIDVFNTSVGFLSATVTIYVGIQIYNAITLRKDIKRMIDKMDKDISEKISLFRNEMKDNIKNTVYKSEKKSLINILTLIVDELYNKGDYGECLYYLSDALDLANQENLTTYSTGFCDTINDIKGKNFKCIVNKEFKMNITKGILNANYSKKEELVDYINSFPESTD